MYTFLCSFILLSLLAFVQVNTSGYLKTKSSQTAERQKSWNTGTICAGLYAKVPEAVEQATCISKTEELLKKTDINYNDGQLTKTEDELTGNTITDDFRTNNGNLVAYAASCSIAGGVFVGLDYYAFCEKDDNEKVNIIVRSHPRCYSKICKATDAQELFDTFTIKLTEERNPVYKCTGQLENLIGEDGTATKPLESELDTTLLNETDAISFEPDTSTCEQQTTRLNSIREVIEAQSNLEPTVSDKKFMFIFDLKEKKVEFDSNDSEALAVECNARKSIFKAFKDTKFQCAPNGDLSDPKLVETFQTLDFSTCLGASCGNIESSQEATNKAVGDQFQKRMMQERLMNKGMVCTMSGAAGRLMGFNAGLFLTLASVGWQLL